MNRLGRNRASNPMSVFISTESNSKSKSPCIFLSHRSLDKPFVRIIAKYIAKAGIDYYFDEEDKALQDATKNSDDKKEVQCIKTGIECSTHFLCILSENSLSSLWMPYEIGYSDAKDKNIACLKLKAIERNRLPSFYKEHNCLMGLSDFNAYLKKIAEPYGGIFFENNMHVIREEIEISNYNTKPFDVIMKSYNNEHPLYDVLEE